MLDDLRETLGDTPPPTDRASSNKPLVVIVDDDASMREALHTLLSPSYRVADFESGAAAVSAIGDEVAVAIVDVRMHEHDGFWTCDAIRAKHPFLPVIFYSAYQDAKDPYEIINQHRPFGYLTKGVANARLLDMVERAIRYSRTYIELKRLAGQFLATQAKAPEPPSSKP